MFAAFLLRYQEFCASGDSHDVRSGTRTTTRVDGEEADNDVGLTALAALGSSRTTAGPVTKTSVNNESGGRDQTGHAQMHAIPGVRTKTKADGEHADYARNSATDRAVPLTAAMVAGNTKTVTYVRAESDDNDPGARSHAIPRCS